MISLLFLDVPERWQRGFQDPATPIMEGIIDLHHDLVFFLIVICSLVSWMLLKTVSHFRDVRADYEEGDVKKLLRAPSRRAHHTVLEIIWTIVPAGILLMVGIPSFSLLYAMDEVIDPTLTVKVIGHQWYWSYEYSDRAFINNKKHNHDSYMILSEDLLKKQFRLLETDIRVFLPTQTHIRFLITAADVLHSWAIPSFGIKVDACPGRLNQTSTYIKRAGIFYGQCSEICGVNHAFMPIQIEALELDDYLFFLQYMELWNQAPDSFDVTPYLKEYKRLKHGSKVYKTRSRLPRWLLEYKFEELFSFLRK